MTVLLAAVELIPRSLRNFSVENGLTPLAVHFDNTWNSGSRCHQCRKYFTYSWCRLAHSHVVEWKMFYRSKGFLVVLYT